MSAILKANTYKTVFEEILEHTAWFGDMVGLDAEKLLRGKKTPFLFLLRSGEKSNNPSEQHYYATFVGADLSVRHQPITVTEMTEGRFFENHGAFGPYANTTTIDDVLYLMLHCEKEQCVPFQR
jgi:hypothetical protein